MTVLDTRALNRATLDRQLLLRRATITATEAIEHLVGMQAQAPFPPYTGLWTRVAGFRPEDLAELLVGRGVVRIALMRSTVHLVSAEDCLRLRPVLQGMLERLIRTAYARQLRDLDWDAVVATAREWVDEKPRGTTELARMLLERWPDRDRQALVNVVRAGLPLVQVPPRAVWGKAGQPIVTTAQAWLGRSLQTGTAPDAMVLRYLGAFGPATVGDVQKWSGLTGLREVVDRLRPGLRIFADAGGAELYDLPDAPRPDPGAAAPVRFLPEFDNLLLSHVDTSRIVAPDRRSALMTVNGIVSATVLVDGFVQATWKIVRTKPVATLEIQPFGSLRASDRAAIEAEGAALLGFAAADADSHEIRLAPAG